VTAGVVAACLALFAWEWAAAPRVAASAHVQRELREAHGALYLGKTFEGFPLRTVRPFLYSDCVSGKAKAARVPCTWVKVVRGHVTGSDPKQVARARRHVRRVI
jgi:hypothetical protein